MGWLCIRGGTVGRWAYDLMGGRPDGRMCAVGKMCGWEYGRSGRWADVPANGRPSAGGLEARRRCRRAVRGRRRYEAGRLGAEICGRMSERQSCEPAFVENLAGVGLKSGKECESRWGGEVNRGRQMVGSVGGGGWAVEPMGENRRRDGRYRSRGWVGEGGTSDRAQERADERAVIGAGRRAGSREDGGAGGQPVRLARRDAERENMRASGDDLRADGRKRARVAIRVASTQPS